MASPAHTTSTTAPAGSRDQSRTAAEHPGALRKRARKLQCKAAFYGQPMRGKDAYAVVLAWSNEADDTSADGFESWLRQRFDPTPAAAIRNTEGGGRDGAA